MAGPAITSHAALPVARAPQSAAPRRTLDSSRTFDHILQASRQRSRVRTARPERPERTQPSAADEIERRRRNRPEDAAIESRDATASELPALPEALVATPPAAPADGVNDAVATTSYEDVDGSANGEAIESGSAAQSAAAPLGSDSESADTAETSGNATTTVNVPAAAAGETDGVAAQQTNAPTVGVSAPEKADPTLSAGVEISADAATAGFGASATDSADEPRPALSGTDARPTANAAARAAPTDAAAQNSDETAQAARSSTRPPAQTAAAAGAPQQPQPTAAGERRSPGRTIDRGIGVQGQRESQRDVQQVTRQAVDGEDAPAPSGWPIFISRVGPHEPTAPATDFAATVVDAPSAETDDGRGESASTPDQNTRANNAPAGGTDGTSLSVAAPRQAEPAPLLASAEGSASVSDARLAAISGASDAPVSLDRLSQTVRAHIDARQWHVQIQLDPPDLGRVRLDVAMKNDALQVRMQVASEQVRRLVEARLPELVQALSDRDMQLAPPTVVVRTASAEGQGAAGDPQREPTGGQQGGDRGGDRGGAAHGQERSDFGAPREHWRNGDSGGRPEWNLRAGAAGDGGFDGRAAAALDRLDLVA